MRKFGQIIGFAKQRHRAGRLDPRAQLPACTISTATMPSPRRRSPRTSCRSTSRRTFQGYRRANGKVGTRNYIGILTSVNCSATVAGFIAEEVKRSGMLDDYPNIDGIMALKHGQWLRASTSAAPSSTS